MFGIFFDFFRIYKCVGRGQDNSSNSSAKQIKKQKGEVRSMSEEKNNDIVDAEVVSSEEKKNEVAEVESGFSFDVGVEGVEGVVSGDMGLRVSKVPVEKYKGSTQRLDMISFLTSKVTAIKTHYFEGVGNLICFGGKCCELGGFPNVRYLFPIVIYHTDGEGNILSPKLDIKVLSAGEDFYKTIQTIHRASREMGGIDHVDLLVTCTDEQYQKLTLSQSGDAKWRKSKKAVQALSDRWKKDGEFMYLGVARKVEPNDFMTLLGVDGGNDSGPSQRVSESNTNLDSFFND